MSLGMLASTTTLLLVSTTAGLTYCVIVEERNRTFIKSPN